MKGQNKFLGLDVDDPNAPAKIGIAIILCWSLSAVLIGLFFDFKSQNMGTFGDMFGAINALFSGLAFAGIIFTIMLQRKELTAQREELELNRQELQLTRLEFEQQTKTLYRQVFETTFFKLLDATLRA